MIQHADDSTYLLRDIKSVINEVKLIHKFSNVARHRLNINKYLCILLGPLKKNCAISLKIQNTNESVKTL